MDENESKTAVQETKTPAQKTPAKPQRPKRKSPEVTGPVQRREMTQVRDEVGAIRQLVRDQADKPVIEDRCTALYMKLDRLDLRFKLHHDPSTKKRKKAKRAPKQK